MAFRINVPHIDIPHIPNPHIEIPNPLESLTGDIKEKLQNTANNLAQDYKNGAGESSNYEDCVLVAAAGCAAAGASMGGPAGAALGAAGGLPAARIACRAIFPE